MWEWLKRLRGVCWIPELDDSVEFVENPADYDLFWEHSSLPVGSEYREGELDDSIGILVRQSDVLLVGVFDDIAEFRDSFDKEGSRMYPDKKTDCFVCKERCWISGSVGFDVFDVFSDTIGVPRLDHILVCPSCAVDFDITMAESSDEYLGLDEVVAEGL